MQAKMMVTNLYFVKAQEAVLVHIKAETIDTSPPATETIDMSPPETEKETQMYIIYLLTQSVLSADIIAQMHKPFIEHIALINISTDGNQVTTKHKICEEREAQNDFQTKGLLIENLNSETCIIKIGRKNLLISIEHT